MIKAARDFICILQNTFCRVTKRAYRRFDDMPVLFCAPYGTALPCPGHTFLCLRASYIRREAAMAAFRDSTLPSMGIFK